MADGFGGSPFGLGKQTFGIARHGAVVFGPLFVNGQNGFDAGDIVGDDGGIHGACQQFGVGKQDVGIDVDDFFRWPVCLLGRDVVRFRLLGFGSVDLKLGFHIRRHIGGVKGKGKGKDGEEE